MRFPTRFLSAPSILLAAALSASAARAQEPVEDEPFLPGLVATFRDADGHAAARIDHQLSFRWGDAAPDPRLQAGPFTATWHGRLNVDASGDYRFYVFGAGEVELRIGGRGALAKQSISKDGCASVAMTLASELQPFELSYRRTGAVGRLTVLWSGPQFLREPLPARALDHPREKTVGNDFERGRLLARTLRCDRCHGGEATLGPDLSQAAGKLSRAWLIRWLTASHSSHGGVGHNTAEATAPRRMPFFDLAPAQAEAIADWLLAGGSQKQGVAKKSKPSRLGARGGERLFLTVGCLACHTWRDLGASGWLGGGDLTHAADKRPAGFFATWLADPAQLNRDHRMPVFTLSDDERAALGLFLADQKAGPTPVDFDAPGGGKIAEGKNLFEQLRCAACHRVGDADRQAAQPAVAVLAAKSDWEQGCLGSPTKQRPGYNLAQRDAAAVRTFYTQRLPESTKSRLGRSLLAELNCLACHAREGTREGVPLAPRALADKLTALGRKYSDLAALIPALTPPTLTSVGDKLHDQALADAIARRGEPHRSYLRVRMPRFPLKDEELSALVQHLVDADRAPDAEPPVPADAAQRDRYALAGGRLVSSDGFGCTSCHALGNVVPPPAPLSARGPSLSLVDRRIRKSWFDRFVRNPARIMPRMEMPSVQIPVSGVLGNRLDEQLAAVWHVVNLPGFQPPPPSPVRIARQLGNDSAAKPLLITDVLHHGQKALVKPFLVGLANRHNALFDLENACLAGWTTGDLARQQTKGKTWFWESAGAPILDTRLVGSDLTLVSTGRILSPLLQGQFITEADAWETDGHGLRLRYRLEFERDGKTVTAHVHRRFEPLASAGGFAQELLISQLPGGCQLRLSVLSQEAARRGQVSSDSRTLALGDKFASRIVLGAPATAKFAADGTHVIVSPDAKGIARVVMHYVSDVPVDRFPAPPPAPATVQKSTPVEIAPGFVGERLPLPPAWMPSAFSWRPNGRLVFTTLKGEVFETADTNGDGTEVQLTLLADGLPTPYGVFAAADYADVSAKYGVLRIRDGGRQVETVASGWGYTRDYHEWAIGLPRNERGEYFLGIPCQQDKRSPTAARFHGNVLRLTPREPSANDPRRYTLTPVSAGHRFPMGLAIDRNGELFVTDNQGNYNPFNELNHVRPGVHFGFINALEKGKPVPTLTPPAIDIPHPWTRSVNGICFLDTPPALRSKLGHNVFGPLEGHLIGCEYDTRRLIRMSLQRVGDTFQGAAYPLSIPPRELSRGFQGPIVCAVSPRGDLYVGSIRDSGWGAGNNLGEIVRVRIALDKLSGGIAEVRAIRDGFEIDFFRPVDSQRAASADSYVIQSYRRESTPAYGGPDRDRRTEKVTDLSVARDARRVTLRLTELRPGFVYEFRLKNLGPAASDFHPAEAHYTLRVIP